MKRSSHTMLLTGLPPTWPALADRARVAGDLFLLMRSPQDAAAADLATIRTLLDRSANEHGVLPPRRAPGRSH